MKLVDFAKSTKVRGVKGLWNVEFGMRKAENMKIRHSSISAFRIPHSALIGIIFFTFVLEFFFLAFDAHGADAGVVVQPIEEAALDDLINNKENTLIVSFMAAWCGPCIDELPALNSLYRKYKDQGLKLIGISIDLEGAAAMQPTITKLKIKMIYPLSAKRTIS
jgi:thiol-disulfide isomerase/thioredoxin